MEQGRRIMASDPQGNRIMLDKELCSFKGFKPDLEEYSDLSMVIEKPIIMIELAGPPAELYYYRSVAWNHTILIAAKKSGNEWTAYECSCNPDPRVLSELLKKGKQLI